MVDKKRLFDHFRDSGELYGWRLSDKRLHAIYFRLNEEGFEDVDVIEALRRYEQDMFRFGEFQGIIRIVRGERIERLAQLQSRIEGDATREWFRKHAGSRTECVGNYNCGTCKRTYCDSMAMEASQAIKDMLSDQKPVDEVHEYLAGKFKGIGFERNVPELEPF
jgi:hypothetical protein